jgi:hypothetical protein
MRSLSWSLVMIVLVPSVALAEDKNSLPGKAQWDLRAFGTLFKVAETKYDPQANQVTWILELKDDVRTRDLIRDLDEHVFQLSFEDADQKQLAVMQMRSSKFKGIPTNEKITKRGTKLELSIDIPGALDKTQQVTLSRVRGQ